MTRYKRRRFIDGASLSLVFSFALVAYFLSTFAERLVGASHVNLLFAFSAAATLLLLPLTVRLMEAIGRGRTTFWAAVLYFVSLVLFALPLPRAVHIAAFVLYNITIVGVLMGLDVVLEKYSSDGVTGTIRGRHLAILNLGLIPGPWISGQVMEHYGFSGLALLAAVFALPVAFVLFYGFYGKGIGFQSREHNMLNSLQLMMRKLPLRYAFVAALLLQIFYAVMIIETPLVLRSLGFTPSQVGLMFAIMLLPFVLIQYPLGRLADRKFGEREMMVAGFLIAGFATAAIAVLPLSGVARSVIGWTALLFVSRIGAAAIEVMRDSYFFKHVDSRDLHVIALLWAAMPLAYLIGPLASSAIVSLSGSFSTVFLGLASALVLFGLLATRMPDTK